MSKKSGHGHEGRARLSAVCLAIGLVLALLPTSGCEDASQPAHVRELDQELAQKEGQVNDLTTQLRTCRQEKEGQATAFKNQLDALQKQLSAKDQKLESLETHGEGIERTAAEVERSRNLWVGGAFLCFLVGLVIGSAMGVYTKNASKEQGQSARAQSESQGK